MKGEKSDADLPSSRELSMARILVLALPLLVGGCFLPVNLTIASLVVNGFSVAATGKGTADHALSAIYQLSRFYAG